MKEKTLPFFKAGKELRYRLNRKPPSPRQRTRRETSLPGRSSGRGARVHTPRLTRQPQLQPGLDRRCDVAGPPAHRSEQGRVEAHRDRRLGFREASRNCMGSRARRQ